MSVHFSFARSFEYPQYDPKSTQMPYESDPTARKLNDLVSSQELYMGLICFDKLKMTEQVLIGTWELVNEFYNGGFLQYFHNSSRDRAKPMIQLLRSIEAHRAAATLEEAIALIGPGTRWGDECNSAAAIRSMPEEIRKGVSDLERAFYNELDNLHLFVFSYLSEHRDEIDAPSVFWTEPINK
jgi:hypothetical protein